MTTEEPPIKELRTKDQIIDFLTSHPGWVLQHCFGIRFHNWWWVRSSPISSETIKCNWSAAKSASKAMIISSSRSNNDVTYILNP